MPGGFWEDDSRGRVFVPTPIPTPIPDSSKQNPQEIFTIKLGDKSPQTSKYKREGHTLPATDRVLMSAVGGSRTKLLKSGNLQIANRYPLGAQGSSLTNSSYSREGSGPASRAGGSLRQVPLGLQ